MMTSIDPTSGAKMRFCDPLRDVAITVHLQAVENTFKTDATYPRSLTKTAQHLNNELSGNLQTCKAENYP